MSARLSFGGSGSGYGDGKRTPLRDCSLRKNRRSTSVPRRMSLGGLPLKGENRRQHTRTPSKDSIAALAEWRQSRLDNDSKDASSSLLESAQKRRRIQETPPLPRPGLSVGPDNNGDNSSSNQRAKATSSEGMTALQRFRQRKALKSQQQQHSQDNEESFIEDKDDASSFEGTAFDGTPSRTRQSLYSAKRCNSATSNHAGCDFSLEADPHSIQSQDGSQNMLSQLTVESDDKVQADPVDNVEGADLRSRIRELQQRVDQLEKEKIDISMSKAPLEAIFRQKEDAWEKEQRRLLQMIDSLKQTNRDANNRYRDLEVAFQATEEECKNLRQEVRKVSSARHNNINGGSEQDCAWGRQLQNDRDVVELKERLRSAGNEIDAIRLEKVSVEKELHANKIELTSLQRRYEELNEEYNAVAESTSNSNEAEIKLQHLTTEHIATSAQLNAVCADLAATKARADAETEEKEKDHREEIGKLQFELKILKKRSERVGGCNEESLLPRDVQDVALLKARIEERDRRITELEGQLVEGESLRRQMHNKIQELRGNIRVFVRTRPFLPSDGGPNESPIDVSPDGETLSITDSRSSTPHPFKFDKVFRPSDGQDSVFGEIADFVQSALDGYHVCLFSYGQTGSGKTHTMQGSGNGAMRGIIPRAVEQILAQAKIMQGQRWEFQLRASFLEIYNEELKDLLVGMSDGKTRRKNQQKLALKRPKGGKSYVEGLTEVPIETTDPDQGGQQLNMLMGVASRARSVARTKMNSQSSRSHSIFMLHLRGYNEGTGVEVRGTLNLCDLAGSERLDRSGAGSDARRLRETQAINKSLSSLGDVFNALAQRSNHVPYRNSKLTYLLQDCLSGDGKALMFVNLSPTSASSSESLCSLRFAQRVNQVELGKAVKSIEYHNGKR